MDEARRSMATWVGTLARGGLIREAREEAGIAVAAFVVGEPALVSLRRWVSAQPPEIVEREQRAAIEVCVWMAHADREVTSEELDLLRAMVLATDLGPVARAELLALIEGPRPAGALSERLTHPVLRELMLALSWELACADGRVDPSERTAHDRLARALDVVPERAAELRAAIEDKVPSSA